MVCKKCSKSFTNHGNLSNHEKFGCSQEITKTSHSKSSCSNRGSLLRRQYTILQKFNAIQFYLNMPSNSNTIQLASDTLKIPYATIVKWLSTVESQNLIRTANN